MTIDPTQAFAHEAKKAMLPAAVCTAITGTVALFALLATVFTSGGRAAPLAVLSVSVALLIPSVLWIRRVSTRFRYRITHRFSPLLLLGLLAACTGLAAVAVLIAGVLEIRAGGLLVALVPLAVPVYQKARTAVLLTRLGGAFGGEPVPWPSISHVVVTRLAGGVEIAAVPRPDAAIPDRTQLSVEVPADRFDARAFVAAVARFAPPAVQVVQR